MRFSYLLLLCIFGFKVSSEVCEFNAKVYPIEYKQETENIYKDVCNWFYKIFNQQAGWPLDEIHYVTSWQDVDIVSEKGEDYLSVLNGIFCCPEEKNKNEIYINTAHFKKEFPVYNQSLLAHEISHFLLKSSNFEKMMKSGAFKNISMYEAFAYWGQNKFIERHSHFNLMNFVDQKRTNCKKGKAFSFISRGLYSANRALFLCHAIQFFDDYTQNKYKTLIDNKFPNVIEEFHMF